MWKALERDGYSIPGGGAVPHAPRLPHLGGFVETFPTVKSDPWKKGKARKQGVWYLWPCAFWERLCKHEEHWEITFGKFEGISPEGLEMIREMNRKIGVSR